MNFGKTYLGIELGSTRIKACLIGEDANPIAKGGFDWQNEYDGKYFTYSLEDARRGLSECYASLVGELGEAPDTLGAIGISGMMHGYLAFDGDWNLLVPFRTWRNTTAEGAAAKLRSLFGFNIPARWSISHLYQAMLDGEEHLPNLKYMTTLSGYIHFLLTGRHELGICEASGMFPVKGGDYDREMIAKFNEAARALGYDIDVYEILPRVRTAGEGGAYLTEDGAALLDSAGRLKSGIPLCPPEGDGGTGMVATNAVRIGTGNVSAGTSVFGMLVLDKPLSRLYPEIDIITTPSGEPVAMAHCNNGCSELDGWVNIFAEFAELFDIDTTKGELYKRLYENAMSADCDCGEVMSYNFLASEPVAKVDGGAPMIFRTRSSKMNLKNLFRSQLCSAIAPLALGMDILFKSEGFNANKFMAHGGLFKVEGVAQQILADALGCEVSISETAGEGGAYGMALLAAFAAVGDGALCDWLDRFAFENSSVTALSPTDVGMRGFADFMKLYEAGLSAQRAIN